MKTVAYILKLIGTIILITLLAVSIPFSAPGFFGYEVYRVASCSMEPTMPLESVIYVKTCGVEEVQINDVITYKLGSGSDKVLTHRVVSADYEESFFITKGDANADVDTEPVAFSRLVGKMVLCVPQLGALAEFVDSKDGTVILVFGLVAVLILWVSADLFTKTAKIQETQEKKKRKIDFVSVLMVVGGTALILYASVNIFTTYRDYEDAKELAQEISADYVEIEANSQEKEWYEQIHVDLEALQNYNPDVIGWIYFENEDISYPILYSGDNESYLRTSIDKTPATAGCIFLEGANTPDLEDSHSIIYGHNMRNLTMFGKLKYYKEDGYYDDHAYFQVFMNGVVHRYQIFAYAGVDSRNFVYAVPYSPTEGFEEFLTKMTAQSLIDTGISVTKEDHVITLSTCSKETDRFVVHAVRVDSHYE